MKPKIRIECSFVYRESEKHETLTTVFFGSGTKLFITFLSLRFSDMRRERLNFFLSWLFHLTPLRAALRCKLLVWPQRAPKIDLLRPSPNLNSLLFFKSTNHQPIASGHDVIHIPSSISYLGFLLWYLWLSLPPRARVNICSQCVHLTNPCTKPKGSQRN